MKYVMTWHVIIGLKVKQLEINNTPITDIKKTTSTIFVDRDTTNCSVIWDVAKCNFKPMAISQIIHSYFR